MASHVADRVVQSVMGSLQPGDILPEVILDKGYPAQKVPLSEICKDRKIIIIGVEGAFTPVCSTKHVPSYVEKEAELKAKGVHGVVVVSVNDGAVMDAWAKAMGVPESSFVRFYADPKGDLCAAAGLVDDSASTLQRLGSARCKRFSMLVNDAKLMALNVSGEVGPDGTVLQNEDTFADRMLQQCYAGPKTSVLAAFAMGSMPMVKVGDQMPEAVLDKGFPPEKVLVSDLCKGRKVVFVGVEGAFTPVCSSKQVPTYLAKESELKAMGIDEVAVVSANDSAVMCAWAKDLRSGASTFDAAEGSDAKRRKVNVPAGEPVPAGTSIINFYGDPKGNLCKATGLVLSTESVMQTLGTPRCKRFSLLVNDGKILILNVAGEAADGERMQTDEDTFAHRLLEQC